MEVFLDPVLPKDVDLALAKLGLVGSDCEEGLYWIVGEATDGGGEGVGC